MRRRATRYSESVPRRADKHRREEESGIKELQAIARGLWRDRDAVEAAVATSWSNGPVEGQVNRLKTTKRAMYGRAKFDLLRQRILHAA